MLLVDEIRSKLDINGNSYHAISVECTESGKSAIATVCAPNTSSALRSLFGDWERVRRYSAMRETVLPVRAFNRLVNGAPDAGCTAGDIAIWIVSAVGVPVGCVGQFAEAGGAEIRGAFVALLKRIWLSNRNLTVGEYRDLIAPHVGDHETAVDCAIRMAGLPAVDWSGTEGNTTAKVERLNEIVFKL